MCTITADHAIITANSNCQSPLTKQFVLTLFPQQYYGYLYRS